MKTLVGPLTPAGYRRRCYGPLNLRRGASVSDRTASIQSESSDSSSSLPYVVLDVFADRPFAGNPLAVVLDAEHLTSEQLQHIAREFNLSETAFPLRPSDDERQSGADYRLRIFTP